MEPTKRAEVVSDRVRKSDLPVTFVQKATTMSLTQSPAFQESLGIRRMLAFRPESPPEVNSEKKGGILTHGAQLSFPPIELV